MGAKDDSGESYGMPWEFYRWQIAEKYGWTLGEVDALSMGELGEWFQIEDALGKYRDAHKQKRR